jgi:hypothetical protein
MPLAPFIKWMIEICTIDFENVKAGSSLPAAGEAPVLGEKQS